MLTFIKGLNNSIDYGSLSGFMDHTAVAKQHAELALSPSRPKSPISTISRIAHAALAAIHACPVVGQIVTGYEKSRYLKAQKTPVPVIDLNELRDPYEVGKAHGRLLKEEIQKLYKEVAIPMIERFEKKYERDTYVLGLALLKGMPKGLIKELKGLAEGAGISYKDVVRVNTFISIFPEETACSSVGLSRDGEGVKVCSLTNGGPGSERLNAAAVRTEDPKKAIKATAGKATIQTTCFRPGKRLLSISRSTNNATNGTYHHYTLRQGSYKTGESEVARNLDWNIPEFAMHTILLKRFGVASVTFPGFIGLLTGMNEAGIHCSYHQNLLSTEGPNYRFSSEIGLAIYHFLKKTTCPVEFMTLISKTSFPGSFHLMIGDAKECFTLSHKADFQRLRADRFSSYKGRNFPTCATFTKIEQDYLAAHPECLPTDLEEYMRIFARCSYKEELKDDKLMLFLALEPIRNTYPNVYSDIREELLDEKRADQAIAYYKHLLLEKKRLQSPKGTLIVDYEKAILGKYPRELLTQMTQRVCYKSPRFEEIWTQYAAPDLWNSKAVLAEKRATFKKEGDASAFIGMLDSLPEFYENLKKGHSSF